MSGSSYLEETGRLFSEHWQAKLHGLFPFGIPNHASWTNLSQIVSVLDFIGEGFPNDLLREIDKNYPDLADTEYFSEHQPIAHVLLPDRGGLDLDGADYSDEEFCADLDLNGRKKIIRPHILAFESFGEDKLEWAYFWMEAANLESTGIGTIFGDGISERLGVLDTGEYVPLAAVDEGHLTYTEDGEEIYQRANLLVRYLTGSFVILSKKSPYNADPSTYDARHNTMDRNEFRNYMVRYMEEIGE